MIVQTYDHKISCSESLFKILITAVLLFAGVLDRVSLAQVAVKAEVCKCKIVEVLPHDVNSYTQGLFFHKGQLYESSGQYGASFFRKVDLSKGTALQSFNFPDEYFAEGATVLGDLLYILTWQQRVVFVYDINTFKPINQFFNPREEGWGLTTDGKDLIMSDGSSYLFFMDPATFKEKRRITVKLDGKAIDRLNELEYIKGEIWANVYQEDFILIIDPSTGTVRKVVDCKNILPTSMRTSKTDVLNGIAYNPLTDKIYITGKYWPKMFRITLSSR
ncbi:MAG: glutaminyl-peptide cyclotransferase [Rikenellaceae bacterium]|jgi:glutamine cyclotransferase